MTHAVESLAYYKAEVPWHGLGNPVNNNLSPVQMLKAAGIDWTVSKRKMFFEKKDGTMCASKDDLALVRDADEIKLSTVGTTYKPVQNAEAMEFFKKFIIAGKMKMETAGSLWGGRYIWGLARIGKDFKLGKDDEVRGFLLMCQPHVHGKAMLLQTTGIRVVCWNTLTMAIGSSLKGDGTAFRMPHSMDFNDEVKAAAEQALGLATSQMAEFQEAATLLSKKKVTAVETESYFCDVLEFDPKEAKKKKDGEDKEPRMLPHLRAALTLAPGQEMGSALGTLWGSFNAVTYVIDHETGRDRSTALRRAWLGSNARLKRRALDLAIARAA
jgi:phage/plasmid-like protein (TIGR03299 family)